jgi:hypothetical protein
MYLVDLLCLGVKDTTYSFNTEEVDYRDILEELMSCLGIKRISYDLAHNIIYSAIEFAEEFDFRPHRDFQNITRYLLENDDDRIPLIEIECGEKGIPTVVENPENRSQIPGIIRHLDKVAGKGNYNYCRVGTYITQETGHVTGRPPIVHDDQRSESENEDFVNDFLEFYKEVKDPEELEKMNPNQFTNILAKADHLFYKHLVEDNEVEKINSEMDRLFDFRVSDDNFSNEILFGSSLPSNGAKEIPELAEEILTLLLQGRDKEGFERAVDCSIRYPHIPVFHYLIFLLRQPDPEKKDTFKWLRTKRDEFPEYLPFQYLYLMSSFLKGKENTSNGEILNGMHLVEKFPARTSFCRQEVSIYIKFLTGMYLGLQMPVHFDAVVRKMKKCLPEEDFNPLIAVGNVLKVQLILIEVSKIVTKSMRDQ